MSLSHFLSLSSLQHSSRSPWHDDLVTARVVPPRHEDCWVAPESAAAPGSAAPRAVTGILMESCVPRVSAVARAEVAARTEIVTMNLHEARIKKFVALFQNEYRLQFDTIQLRFGGIEVVNLSYLLYLDILALYSL